MMTETRVKLDKFQPRPYQIPLINAVESGEYRKILALWCRRCLHGDTHIIMADGSFKLLKDIQEGDLILSWNGTEFETDRVKNVWKTEPKETLKISAHAMPDIITSKDHLFYSYNIAAQYYSWTKACDIEINDNLFTYYNDGIIKRVIDVRPCAIESLYDIETAKNHNFVANGYLVHNSGKDVCGWNLIIRAAIRKVGNYFYCLPTFKQCRLVIFDSITIDGTRFLDYLPKELVRSVNISEMKITLNNNSVIQLIGSDSYDTALVGTNPRMVIFSEAALSDERAYQLVRPIMNANLGLTVFLSTPRGHNWFYNLYEIARNSPEDWYSCKLTVDDCQHISIADIQKEIESGEMSEDMAQQEYWCSFDAGVEGSYYSKYLDKMKLENRITEVPWEPNFKVHLAMDIGYSDDTTIIWFQVIGTTIHVIDCYSRSKEGLEHYVNVIKSKPYTYGKCFAPHDIQVTEWGSGISRIEKAKQLGLKLVPLPKSDLMDGIESVRSTLPRVWIDQKCSNLIHALESYHQEYDSKRKVYNLRPLHDWSSHYADAMRYLALSVSRCRDTITPEELDQRYYNAMLQGTEANMPKPFRNI